MTKKKQVFPLPFSFISPDELTHFCTRILKRERKESLFSTVSSEVHHEGILVIYYTNCVFSVLCSIYIIMLSTLHLASHCELNPILLSLVVRPVKSSLC